MLSPLLRHSFFDADPLFERMQRMFDNMERDLERTFGIGTFQMEEQNDDKAKSPAIEQDKKNEHVAVKEDEKSKNDNTITGAPHQTNDKSKSNSQITLPSLFGEDSLFKTTQRLFDSIERDIENRFNNTFDTFKELEHKVLEDSEHTSYFTRSKVNDNGHVHVKTVQKEPNSDWKVHVEEYDTDKSKPSIEQGEKKTQNMAAIKQDEMSKNDALVSSQNNGNKTQIAIPSLFDVNPFFVRTQRMIDSMKTDFENHFNRTLDTFKTFEHKALLEDPEHTWYFRKSIMDDNGHVRVKTVQKEPKSDWKVNVEEYDRDNAAVAALKHNEKSKTFSIEQDSKVPNDEPRPNKSLQ